MKTGQLCEHDERASYLPVGIDYASKDGDAVYIQAERSADGGMQIVRELRVPAKPESR